MTRDRRGINVPTDPKAVHQRYHDSSIEEYFTDEKDRDNRFDQIVKLKRSPIKGFTFDRPFATGKLFFLRWTEPRGPELSAIEGA